MSKGKLVVVAAFLASVAGLVAFRARLTRLAGPPGVGDVVKRGDLSLSVVGWRELDSTPATFPKPGHRFVAVGVVLANGATPAILDGLHLEAGGARFEFDLNACLLITARVPFVGPALLPGQRVGGEIGFQIPKDASGLRFVFGKSLVPVKDGDGLLPTGEETVIALGPTPVRARPPAGPRPGEHEVGEAVDADGLALTVHGAEPLAPADAAEPPKRGNRWLVVDVSLENRRAEAAKISFVLAFRVVDGSGASYGVFSMTTIALLAGTNPDEIAPGGKVRFKLAAEVPRDRTGFALEFEPALTPQRPVASVALPDLPFEAEPPPGAAAAEKPRPVVERKLASTVQLGEVVAVGSLCAAVLGWREVEWDDWDHPREGNRFVAVEAMLVNPGAVPVAVDAAQLLVVRDPAGHEYASTLSSSRRRFPLESTFRRVLEPGETVRGEVGCELPAREEELGLVVDGDAPVLVALGTKPRAVAAPPTVPGAKLAPASEPGSTLVSGDLAVTVLDLGAAASPMLEKRPGLRWLALEVKLENRGTAERTGGIALDRLGVVDAAGRGSSVAAARRAFGPLVFRELLPLVPGGSLRGFVCFEAGADPGELRLGVLDGEGEAAKKAWVRLGPVPREPVGLEAAVAERLETVERAGTAGDLALVLLAWRHANALVETDPEAKPAEAEAAKARVASARTKLLPVLARAYRAVAEDLLAALDGALAKADDGFLEDSDLGEVLRDMRREDPSLVGAAEELARRGAEIKNKPRK